MLRQIPHVSSAVFHFHVDTTDQLRGEWLLEDEEEDVDDECDNILSVQYMNFAELNLAMLCSKYILE